jgi:rhamnose transport system ATP-binding protein
VADVGPLLELRAVSKSFGGVRALRGVSFDLRRGEVHALVGENGAGKSTLVRILTGAVAADSGTVEIEGRAVRAADPGTMRALGVAPIYQQPALLGDLTVAENLALGLEGGGLWRRVRWRERRRRAAALLARVDAAIDVDAPAHSLRMAEQQLVEIARALGADARILLMDEPTAALTDREAARLFDLVRDLRANGVGIVYISHRLEEVAALADRVSVLRDGELVATQPMGETTPGELIRLMVGRAVEATYPRRAVPLGDLRLELLDVGCREAGLRGVSLTLSSNEIVGLAGLVGSGRTELARTLFGLTPPDEGVVRLDGKVVHIRTPSEAVRLGLAYLPEDRRRHGVIGEMSVAANTTLAALRAISRAGFLEFGKEREVARTYLRRFAIKAPSIEAPVANLSGGNQQKVALARWLATQPSVLILDEPTQGVDVGAKAEIHWLIRDLAAQGLAILLISSELPEVLGMSDRVAVMRGGTIVGTLEGKAATPEAVMTLALGHVPEVAPAAGDRLPAGGHPSPS